MRRRRRRGKCEEEEEEEKVRRRRRKEEEAECVRIVLILFSIFKQQDFKRGNNLQRKPNTVLLIKWIKRLLRPQ